MCVCVCVGRAAGQPWIDLTSVTQMAIVFSVTPKNSSWPHPANHYPAHAPTHPYQLIKLELNYTFFLKIKFQMLR